MNGGITQTTGTFSNLIAGQYQFTITDSQGCIVQLDTTITEPTELIISLISADTTSCNAANGLFEVNAVGGTGSSNYSIDNFSNQQSVGLFDSLFSDSYFVEVQDANGCTDTLTVFVPADSSVQVSLLAQIDITCNGANDGAVSVNASVGPLPYSYSINNGVPQNFSVFSNLSPGTYSITVSDGNGCKDSIQATITEPSELIIDAVQPPAICAGDSVNLIASVTGGVSPYSYSWNGTISGNPAIDFPNSPTTYILNVTDANGCFGTDQFPVNVINLPIADADFSPSSGYEPITVVFSNLSQNADSYEWNFGNGQISSVTDLNPISISYLNAGTYYIQLIASNELCTSIWFDSVIVLPYEMLEIEVPNVFSPNGDGSNEGYSIITKNATSIEAVIVNRWGVKMVEITDLNYKWDGKTNSGSEASDGVYFVKYKVNGLNNQEKVGHTFFHLIR
jgi:gliding motility-associated-like protein